MEAIIVASLTSITSIVLAFLKYRSDKKLNALQQDVAVEKHSINVMQSLSSVFHINRLHKAVAGLFARTPGNRFLILLAVNGKVSMKTVSVIYEQRDLEDLRVNATAKYHKITVDDTYVNMLKTAEATGSVELNVEIMPDSLLKSIYIMEGVNHSLLTFLHRKPLDDDNDVVVYSTIATESADGFTPQQLTDIRLEYESVIKPIIEDIISHGELL